MLSNAVVAVLRRAVTAHRDSEPKCEDLFRFPHQKGSVPPVMVQYTLLTHQKIYLFFWQTLSPGLHGVLTRSDMLAFK